MPSVAYIQDSRSFIIGRMRVSIKIKEDFRKKKTQFLAGIEPVSSVFDGSILHLNHHQTVRTSWLLMLVQYHTEKKLQLDW
jgi:hypothetical protein